MQANRSKDTTPERAIRSALHRAGFRFFVHRRPEAGLRCTADIVFPAKKICIFVDGCFWHGCEVHGRTPKRNAGYWQPKIARNVERDRRNDAWLGDAGWTVLRIWEHEPVESATARVAAVLKG
jgi:DNA mismatch endonuclease (patch repair protein)